VKKVLFVSYLSPVGSEFVSETFKMVSKIKDEIEHSILLKRDSVIALNDEDSLEDLEKLEKRIKIYAVEEDVERRRIKSREGLKVELLSRKKLYDLMKKIRFRRFYVR